MGVTGCGKSKTYEMDLANFELSGYVLNEAQDQEALKSFSQEYRAVSERHIRRMDEVRKVSLKRIEKKAALEALNAKLKTEKIRLEISESDASSLSSASVQGEIKTLETQIAILEAEDKILLDEQSKIVAEKEKAYDERNALRDKVISESLDMNLRIYRDVLYDKIRAELHIDGREEPIRLDTFEYDEKATGHKLHFKFEVPTETSKKVYEVVIEKDAETVKVEVPSQNTVQTQRFGTITLIKEDKTQYGEIAIVKWEDLKTEVKEETVTQDEESVQKEDKTQKEDKPGKDGESSGNDAGREHDFRFFHTL